MLSILVSEQANADELSFEAPLRSGEAFLRERGRHWLDPVGKGLGHGGDDTVCADLNVILRNLVDAFIIAI